MTSFGRLLPSARSSTIGLSWGAPAVGCAADAQRSPCGGAGRGRDLKLRHQSTDDRPPSIPHREHAWFQGARSGRCRDRSARERPAPRRHDCAMPGSHWRATPPTPAAGPRSARRAPPPVRGTSAPPASDYGADLFNRSDFGAIGGVLRRLKGRFILSLNDHTEVRRLFGCTSAAMGANLVSCGGRFCGTAKRERVAMGWIIWGAAEGLLSLPISALLSLGLIVTVLYLWGRWIIRNHRVPADCQPPDDDREKSI
jgi:hypothetical protein